MHKWWEVIEGDCREVMAGLEPESVDAIVCDPPYELGFMGKGWDSAGVSFEVATWQAAYRILKPGGHLLAFGGTRTYHRIAVAIEDAGFEIRDCLSWLYGSGFPKSLDVSKAIDKMAGAEREVVGVDPVRYARLKNQIDGSLSTGDQWQHGPREVNITAPATPEAERWAGWGTALKPAWEPVIVARKPLGGRTVAANVLQHGTGALNIDGTRIDGEARSFWNGTGRHGGQLGGGGDNSHERGEWQPTAEGRWPANVAIDEAAAEMLDAQSGTSKSPSGPVRQGGHHRHDVGLNGSTREGFGVGYGDTGGASRFYYVAKASRRERNAGLDGMPERALNWSSGEQSPGTFQSEGTNRMVANPHPTVKPIALMRWLVRLVTPPGGLVVDPFNGSGSTGIAAVLEGFRYIGIEQSAEYAEIARRRIAHWEAEHLATLEAERDTPAQLALDVA